MIRTRIPMMIRPSIPVPAAAAAPRPCRLAVRPQVAVATRRTRRLLSRRRTRRPVLVPVLVQSKARSIIAAVTASTVRRGRRGRLIVTSVVAAH